jgi:hypothetical protein
MRYLRRATWRSSFFDIGLKLVIWFGSPSALDIEGGQSTARVKEDPSWVGDDTLGNTRPADATTAPPAIGHWLWAALFKLYDPRLQRQPRR